MRERTLAFLIQDLRGGGAESTFVRLVNGTAERGIPTDLVVVTARGPFLGQLSPALNLIELPQARTATSVVGLCRYLRRRRPRALISAMTHTNIAAILARAAAQVRTRLVIVEHNQFSRNVVHKRGLVRLAYRLVPLLYRHADVVAAVSEGVRADLARAARLPADRIAVLTNPVVTPDLFAAADQVPDHPWFLDREVPVLLAVGRLMPQKNYPLLLDAFARLRTRRPARLIILGEGALRAQIEGRAEELGIAADVALPGFCANPFAFMRAASLFVLSSDWEGMPTVLIEALACGVPVVATDCRSGPRDILQHGRLGRLVPVGRPDMLAAALEQALLDPGDPQPRIDRAREFGVERSVERYLAVAGW